MGVDGDEPQLVQHVRRLEAAQEKRRICQEERRWSQSLVWTVRLKKKQVLWFASGDRSEERPYVELRLLSKGVLVEEEPVVLGLGVTNGEQTPVMVTALMTPLIASLNKLN